MRADARWPGQNGSVTDSLPEDPPLPPPAQHVRARRGARVGAIGVALVGAVLVLGSSMAITAALLGGEVAADERLGESPVEQAVAVPPAAESLPAPLLSGNVEEDDGICARPGVSEALAATDDAAVIESMGGAEAFRAAIVDGEAECIHLDDPAHVWVVANKTRPYDPIDYRPESLEAPSAMRSVEGRSLRADAGAALSALAAAARNAGVGEIALNSGFRSYETQQNSYASQLSSRGREQADALAAHPGYSEHQSGLAADVVACAGSCGDIYGFADTAQGAWVRDHAWEYGWIIRYAEGQTETTGYVAEPWHLRYIGLPLAAAYREGEWTTLEEFFGLPPAPDYLD